MRMSVCSVLLSVLIVAAPLRSQSVSPRLLVILVVDQMRADYLTVFERHWARGFRTLIREGAVFENAAYPYANTVTCAGHATVATGTFPRTHGIVGNNWWDSARWRLVDCSIDSTNAGAHVSYGRPAEGGNSPHLLTVPTIGEELERQRSGSRVVVLSLKPDSSVALAGRSGSVVTWFDGTAGAFVTSRAYSASPNPFMADAIARNPLSKELSRTWTLLKSPDVYMNSDAAPGERAPAGRDGLFPHDIGGANGPDARSVGLWQRSPYSDQYLERLAENLIERMGLGRDDVPDLLAIGFSALDLVGHASGPESREVEDVLAHLDVTIGDLLNALDRQVGRDRYVLALTADHGIPPVPSGSRGGLLAPEEVQQRIEEMLRSRGFAGRNSVAVRAPYVYFAPDILPRLRQDRSLWQAIMKAVLDHPGVLRILLPEDLRVTATDAIVRAAAFSYVPGRSGDLVVVPRAGWIMQGRNAAAATNHGSPHGYDRRVPLVLIGGGIRNGRFREEATPADIAPTLADLTGIKLERAEGRVLREALTRR
jgi:predicted AlkP superfamily pyrophosphatase or phosphodiesterase